MNKTKEVIIDLSKRLPKHRKDIYNIYDSKSGRELCRLIILNPKEKNCYMVIDSDSFEKPKLMPYRNLIKVLKR